MWVEDQLPLVEFAYNNSYQASIQMEPYEALCGRPCRLPLCWTEVEESSITGPDLIRDTSEKVSLIRQRLLTAQSRQKSYTDVRRRPLEFEVGDHIFLKVSMVLWAQVAVLLMLQIILYRWNICCEYKCRGPRGHFYFV